ncbi:N-(5'-phosphoribosyl)anthranilate isomerase [Mucisphaera calidilacus]|uniref:N-(5'-phosphoribosyl)anthranilate isomerase n=2 Tax=Mucisphaera calidilacus TaxID=2527982 RepID=A0A518BV57_9BACT|nr:N-(5'-phosphoribosyl)anthranilate isomerase [Mucisphaera calidilacus]
MPSGPGTIDDHTIARVARAVPPGISRFLLTSETRPDAVVDHARRTHVDTVQLVDDQVTPDVYAALRQHCPALRIVQVIHVIDDDSLDKAISLADHVDALLLDSGNPTAAVPELGGTGRRHDWSVSRSIVRASPVPVFLAGGIRPDNVAEAIRTVQPFGIDLCTRVRTDGRLHESKLKALIDNMNKTC